MENKYKKLFRVLLSINVLVIILALGGGYLYLNRDDFKDLKLYYEFKEIKSKILEISDDYEIFDYKENVHNAYTKLDLTSAYGDNQPTHPKVISFDKKWNGYKYWMTYSPYPYSNDKYENPHIKVSNDLINWVDPEGFTNPLEDTPEDYVKSSVYNSDPHLVYNSDTDTLECYYRFVDNTKDLVIIYRKTTQDGINWTEKEVILENTRSEVDYVSPAIIYEDGIYKMWYVKNDYVVMYEESTDGYNYSGRKQIDLTYANINMKTWHLDVIKTDLGYEMITVGFESWSGRSSMNLYYFSSSNNEEWSKGYPIIKPSQISWDNGGIYRSSFIKEDGIYYVFYSAISKENEKGIGLSYGNDIYNLLGYTKKTSMDKSVSLKGEDENE